MLDNYPDVLSFRQVMRMLVNSAGFPQTVISS